MSLRWVHIFFILAADSLCILFGLWGLQSGTQALGVASLGVSVALLFYLVWFIRKSKGL